jgi:cyanate permease
MDQGKYGYGAVVVPGFWLLIFTIVFPITQHPHYMSWSSYLELWAAYACAAVVGWTVGITLRRISRTDEASTR